MLLAMPIAHFSGSFVCSALSIFRRDLTVSGHAEPDFMRRIHRFTTHRPYSNLLLTIMSNVNHSS